MADVVEFPNGYVLEGAGHYHETYKKIDGAWRIQRLHLTRTRITFTPPGDTVVAAAIADLPSDRTTPHHDNVT
jgi:hypothetical protein